MSDTELTTWRALGTVPPATLAATRAGLHANLLAAACAHPERGADEAPILSGGFDYVPAEEGALLLARGPELRPGLRVRDAHLVLFDAEENEIDAVFDLERQTWPQARIWLEAQCAASGLDFSASRFELPASVFDGLDPEELEQTFSFSDLAAAEELEAWIANAFGLIAKLGDFSSEVRLDAGRFHVAREEPSGTVIGLSLGEPACPEPFFFARPEPAGTMTPPRFKSVWMSDLSAGEAFVLRAEDLCSAPAAGCQEKHARAFLEASLRI